MVCEIDLGDRRRQHNSDIVHIGQKVRFCWSFSSTPGFGGCRREREGKREREREWEWKRKGEKALSLSIESKLRNPWMRPEVGSKPWHPLALLLLDSTDAFIPSASVYIYQFYICTQHIYFPRVTSFVDVAHGVGNFCHCWEKKEEKKKNLQREKNFFSLFLSFASDFICFFSRLRTFTRMFEFFW